MFSTHPWPEDEEVIPDSATRGPWKSRPGCPMRSVGETPMAPPRSGRYASAVAGSEIVTRFRPRFDT